MVRPSPDGCSRSGSGLNVTLSMQIACHVTKIILDDKSNETAQSPGISDIFPTL